jgi:quercetin dioxygenase-like cupin family protein
VHHVGRLEDTAPDNGPYEGRSEGYDRRTLVDRAAGSVHQAMTVSALAPGGRVDPHLHAFEEGIYVLEGSVRLTVAGAEEELTADDFCFVGVGVPHSFANASPQSARWFEVSAPQPGAALDDTVFVADGAKGDVAEPAYRRDRFELGELPEPSSAIGLAGFGAANVGGASLRILMEQSFGASQFNLMVVRYAEGGFIREHDHAFEEGFFFLGGEIEAVLDGQTYALEAGDYCWSGVGSMHALSNRGTEPVHWLETQVPQPPSRHQARFRGEWERLIA